MSKIQDLIEKRKQAWEDAKKYANENKNENGILDGQNLEAYNKAVAVVDAYTAEIERVQKEEEKEKMLNAAMSNPVQNDPQQNPMNSIVIPAKKGIASDEYKRDFVNLIRSRFTAPLSNVMTEGVDSAGGYLCPTEFDDRLIEGLEDENVMRKLATIIQTSNDHIIPIQTAKAAAAWIDEGGALDWKDATFNQVQLKAHKLTVAIKISEELLQDSKFDLEAKMIQDFSSAIGNAEEDAFLNGNGTGKPTGIFDATNGGTVADEISDIYVKADDVINLIYHLKRVYRKNASFITADSTVRALRMLKDQDGRYLWEPSLQVGEPDRLLGYPLYTSPNCPGLEAGNCFMAFGDFKYYNIGDRMARTVQELRELFAGNGQYGLVCKERVDGILTLKEAVQILKVAGSDTAKKTTKTSTEV